MQLTQSIKENITILHCAELLGYHPVQRRGNTLSWTLQEHDSLVITLDSNQHQRFIWNSQRLYGSVIDFYMAMTGADLQKTLHELGNLLKSRSISSWNVERSAERKTYERVETNQSEGLQLPEKSHNGYRRAYAYLIKSRGLNPKLVSELFEQKILYQDALGNAVFVGTSPQTNHPEYASVRGTLSERVFRKDVMGSKKEISFHFNLYREPPPSKLFVCEAPIDAMSIASALMHYRVGLEQYGFLSLGGVSLNALEYHLKHSPQIKTIYLCQDNDEAGNQSRQAAVDYLVKNGFEGKIVEKPPICKDFNEDLLQIHQRSMHTEQKTMQPAIIQNKGEMLHERPSIF